MMHPDYYLNTVTKANQHAKFEVDIPKCSRVGEQKSLKHTPTPHRKTLNTMQGNIKSDFLQSYSTDEVVCIFKWK